MPITGCLAAGEALFGIRPGSRCPVWSGCAVTTTGGSRATGCWPTVSVYRYVTAITPCSEIPVFHHGRWVLLDDNGGLVPVDADGQGFEVAS